jgi:hypothetical protein
MSRRIGILALVVGMLYWLAPFAHADPDETASASPSSSLAESPTLLLSDMGVAPRLAFFGQRDMAFLSFPVPDGLKPVSLNAVLEVPLNVRTIVVTVTQDDRTVGRVELPPMDRAPISIPLDGIRVTDRRATVTVTVTMTPVEGYCIYAWDGPLFVDPSISYRGTEIPPATVADFLPPVLRKLTIGIPAKPSQADSNAAVRLATAIAARYGGQRPEVALVPLDQGVTTLPTPPAPLERQIVIAEGPNAGVSLKGDGGVPTLSITGSGEALVNQIRLLNNDLLSLALSAGAVAPSLSDDAKLPGDEVTLGQLGQSGSMSAFLSPQVTIGIDQTRFGHPIQNVRVHLIGSYSPTPRDVGGQLVAMVGEENLSTWSTDDRGLIDRWVDIPNRLLTRYTNLVVKLDRTGNSGNGDNCGNFQSTRLTVDGSGQVVTSPASPPVPPGFQSLPQALMPRVLVGIGPDAFVDTARAVSILVGLQRQSAVLVPTTVTSLDEATNSTEPAVLIAADGWNNSKIPLPVASSDNDKGITVNGFEPGGKPTTLTLSTPVTYGSLQTVVDGQRTVLIATSNRAPQQLDALLGSLTADPDGWGQLAGKAVISLPGREPVTIPNPEVPEDDASAPHNNFRWAWWVGGGVVALAALGAVVSLLVSRQSARAAHRMEARARAEDESSGDSPDDPRREE